MVLPILGSLDALQSHELPLMTTLAISSVELVELTTARNKSQTLFLKADMLFKRRKRNANRYSNNFRSESMATDITSHVRDPGLPPAYDKEAPDAGGQGDEMQDPAILIVSGQSIFAESVNSPELYRLNRGITSLSYATSNVEMARIERTVRQKSDDPTIKQRERHIYNISNAMQGMRSQILTMAAGIPRIYASPVSSRNTLGKPLAFRRRVPGLSSLRKRMGSSSSSSSSSSRVVEWQAVSLKRAADSNVPRFFNDDEGGGDVLFEVRRLDKKEDRVEWVDCEGNAAAFEEGERRRVEPTIVVTKAMRRVELDALVALWCCRLWERSAEEQPRFHEGF
jgi:hypothetical protein